MVITTPCGGPSKLSPVGNVLDTLMNCVWSARNLQRYEIKLSQGLGNPFIPPRWSQAVLSGLGPASEAFGLGRGFVTGRQVCYVE